MSNELLIDGLHPRSVGIKAGGWDDADHIVRAARDRYTLCHMDAASRNVVVLGDDIDSSAACWSCVHAASTATLPGGRDA